MPQIQHDMPHKTNAFTHAQTLNTTAGSSGTVNAEQDWFVSCSRHVHLDMHVPAFAQNAFDKLSPEKMAQTLERANVEMVAIFAKDHFGNSYYNTQAGHRDSRLKFDFLAEMSGHCRRRGIRILAYYSMCWDKFAWDHFPQWRYVPTSDCIDPGIRSWGGFLCPNSGYFDQWALPQLREIVDYPDIDGIFIDTPFAGGTRGNCCCDACVAMASEQDKRPANASVDPHVADRKRMATTERWLKALRMLVDQRSGNLRICMNTGSTHSVNFNIKQMLDIGVWESQPKAGDYLCHSFACRTASQDNLPAQIMTVRFHKGWGDQTLKPAAQLQTEAASILANAMPVCIGDQVDVDGTLSAPVYDVLGEVNQFVKQRETILRGARMCQSIGIMIPTGDDPTLPLDAQWRRTADESTNGLYALRGAHRMMVESHLQAELFYEASLLENPKLLDNYALIILPGIANHVQTTVSLLASYVENGGVILATGESITGANAKAMADLMGLSISGKTTYSSVHFKSTPALETTLPDMAHQFRGSIVEATATQAKELAVVHLPMGASETALFRSPYAPAAHDRSAYVFASLNHVGHGTAAYIAGSIFNVYWQNGHHWLRQLVDSVVRQILPCQLLETDSPPTVECNLLHASDGLILTALAYTLGLQGVAGSITPIERHIPVHDVTCSIRCDKPQQVTLEPEGNPLAFEWADGRCTFIIPRIDCMAVVKLRINQG